MNGFTNTGRVGSATRLARRTVLSLLALMMFAATPALLAASATPAGALSDESWAQVGTTGTVHYIAPYCTASGLGTDYSDLSGGGRICYYGNASVWQSPAVDYVYKDVYVYANGVLIIAGRFRTQCFAGANLCGTGYPGTTWYQVTSTGNAFVPQSFSTGGRKGVPYCFVTTVWFKEGGRWLSNTLTTHVQW
ncbi:MAG: hypothetical protein M3Q30_09625 [Actinomycetota bacterium]|nr:hypothetical protein [Actinomycetota bacterium]